MDIGRRGDIFEERIFDSVGNLAAHLFLERKLEHFQSYVESKRQDHTLPIEHWCFQGVKLGLRAMHKEPEMDFPTAAAGMDLGSSWI